MSAPARGLYARFTGLIRGFALLLALGGAALLVGWLLVQHQVHDEIRREIERRFAARYAAYRVTVRTARLLEGRGVEIHGITIADRRSARPVVQIDELLAVCPLTIEALLAGQEPPTRDLHIRGLKIWAEQGADGTWNVAPLWPPPAFGAHATPVAIADAAVEIVLGPGGKHVWHLRGIQATLTPETAAGGSARPAGTPAPVWLRMGGTLQGDHFEQLEIQARVAPRGGAWEARGKVTGLQFTEESLATLPERWRQQLGLAAAVRGRWDLAFSTASPPAGATGPRFSVTGELSGGEIVDARLPYRLHDVTARVACDNERLTIDPLMARHGSSTLRLTLARAGLEAGAPLTLAVEARQWTLERRIVEFLPAEAQAVWRKYFPAGTINAQLRLVFDGRRWQPSGEVECVDVSFAYHKFPYRVERAHGLLRLKDDQLQVRLTAFASGQSVQIQGDFHSPGAGSTGWVELSSNGPLPIDEKLLAAVVDPKAQQVIRALQPGGMFTFTGRFERLRPDEPTLHKRVQIQVHNGSLRYAKFPYPLNTIQGTVVWDDSGWTFQKLAGRNDSGYVEGEGSWKAATNGGGELVLNLIGTDIPLEDELRDALTPGARRLWSDLRPRGSLDHLKVDIGYSSATRQLQLDVWAQKWKRRTGDEGRSVALHPVWFPYRLDEVTGAIHLHDGQVVLQNVTAIHNDTEITAAGGCRFDQEGGWNIQLTNLIADRLRVDRDLLAALPAGLGKAITRLNLQGAVALRGRLDLAGVAGSGWKPAARWDLVVDLENGGLRSTVQVDHVHGELQLQGSSNHHGFLSHGELNVDSLVFKDVQLTQIRGPLRIDPNRVVFGAAASQGRPDQTPRSLTAQVFGGLLSTDASIDFEGDLPFRLQMRLEHGDLARIAQELAWKNPNVRGTANAVVDLRGTPQGPHSWRGTGFVRLFEADIYEIPVMLALLKLVSIRRPDTTAFTSSDIDFRIQGEDIYLDRINFNGDAVSLKGHGEMNLDRQIALQFYTLVGQTELRPPALRALLRTASRQLLLIHVTGTLDEPQLTRDPLPLLKETLEQVFPELAERPASQRLPPH